MKSSQLPVVLAPLLFVFALLWLLGFNGFLGNGYALAWVDTDYSWLNAPLKIAPLAAVLYLIGSFPPSGSRTVAKIIGYGVLGLYLFLFSIGQLLFTGPQPQSVPFGAHRIQLNVANPGAFGTAYTYPTVRCSNAPLGLTRILPASERVKEWRPSVKVEGDIVYLSFPNSDTTKQITLHNAELDAMCNHVS